ncbi:phosphogluconate dehydratase [Ferrovibrio sp.]|uniref:phosphogluconate dehydratase n=1 Tax=Ferrovibrio sp. TaxID=1917215 RepID=UPI001B40A115|nr:phosphogluconate dehydratase [Ferrovibrio sp.]MBP7063269.1 phosphogluconate dehydratase [Ferrovibrio sp.]
MAFAGHGERALHPVVSEVTERIRQRSHAGRQAYLAQIEAAIAAGPARPRLGCANLAHAFAACDDAGKAGLRGDAVSIGIVTAYNDMLSAHQPLERFPALIRVAAQEAGAVAQVAGGVPAMCDGITQGEPGMELSLFSRDVIALSTAVALSHNSFDAALCLGVCDKIVPGLLIGASRFGHLPFLFVPAGPMPSGLSNTEKSRLRQLAAEGKLDRAGLLDAEAKAYHAPGTCTFYGTANSNQMLMEIMGLHLPGASFVNPNTPLRDALTQAAVQRVVALAGAEALPLAHLLDERSYVNAIIGLLATGGSTNHTLHLLAMAAAIGITLTWQDFSDLSAVVPLLARIYPNGTADVNAFQAAGGMPVLIGFLLDAGLLHDDVQTVAGPGLARYRQRPLLDAAGKLAWHDMAAISLDRDVLRPVAEAFAADGGLKLLDGNLGRAVIKVSAVKPQHRLVEASARIFEDQAEFQAAFARGELEQDFIAVVRFQGPQANGMPELHKLTPPLGVLQDRGYHVALVTDGRMSGASGKVPAAIHVTPEAAAGGMLARLRDGDRLRLDAETGRLEVLLSDAELASRQPAACPPSPGGSGRELFGLFRRSVGSAEVGASIF